MQCTAGLYDAILITSNKGTFKFLYIFLTALSNVSIDPARTPFFNLAELPFTTTSCPPRVYIPSFIQHALIASVTNNNLSDPFSLYATFSAG